MSVSLLLSPLSGCRLEQIATEELFQEVTDVMKRMFQSLHSLPHEHGEGDGWKPWTPSRVLVTKWSGDEFAYGQRACAHVHEFLESLCQFFRAQVITCPRHLDIPWLPGSW